MNPLQTIRMNGFRKVVGRKDQYTKISCISYTHIEQYKNKPKEAISFKRENNKNKKQKWKIYSVKISLKIAECNYRSSK